MAAIVASFKRAKQINSHRQLIHPICIRNGNSIISRLITSSFGAPAEDVNKKGRKKEKKIENNPKSIVFNFYQVVKNRFNDESYKPYLKFESLEGKLRKQKSKWKATLHLKWPQTVKFEALGVKKIDAETEVYVHAVELLRNLKVLTAKNQVVLEDEPEPHQMRQKLLYNLKLSPEIENKMKTFLQKFSNREKEIEEISKEEGKIEQKFRYDVITGKPLNDFKKSLMEIRNFQLRDRYENIKEFQKSIKMDHLPVFNYKNEILSAISQNPVIIISGQTGCGKTTQIPQYIFNSFMKQSNGAECNVVITQPRRISAISNAEHVAKERNEQLGETIGFQVRLLKKTPREKGAILFCSLGILLNRLQNNPNLEGISHVIIDEAHERDTITDFLLVLLRDIVQKKQNTSLRIILMSASMNVEKLSKYFENCPIINVPGRTFPVKDIYLDELLEMKGNSNFYLKNRQNNRYNWNDENILDLDLVVRTLILIDATKPPGAILCFLPGWKEIEKVYEKLKKYFPDGTKHSIFPVHSRINNQDQHRIFDKMAENNRKIVLATNIAETSITIPDVVYVVDSGRSRDTNFDTKYGDSTLRTNWVTKANMIQRKGRAGRIQPGECYHLYPEEMVDKFKPFPVPEIQTISLEKVILDAKLYCDSGNKSAIDFLSRCPDPPPIQTIEYAISDLKNRKILDDDESLTPLGRYVSKFQCHPYIAKAVIFGNWLRCLNPVLSIASWLECSRSPYLNLIESKDIREMKRKFSEDSFSDHVAFANIIENYNEETPHIFCKKNHLHHKSMEMLNEFRDFFRAHVSDIRGSSRNVNNNLFSCNWQMITAAMCAGFEPNYLKTVKGLTRSTSIKFKDVNDKTRSRLISESVNYKYNSNDPLPYWLTYYLKFRSTDSPISAIKDTSPAPPIAVLLFSGRRLEVHSHFSFQKPIDIEDPVILSVDGKTLLSFICSKSNAELLIKLRKCVDKLLSLHLNVNNCFDNPTIVNELEEELLELLKNLFEYKKY